MYKRIKIKLKVKIEKELITLVDKIMKTDKERLKNALKKIDEEMELKIKSMDREEKHEEDINSIYGVSQIAKSISAILNKIFGRYKIEEEKNSSDNTEQIDTRSEDTRNMDIASRILDDLHNRNNINIMNQVENNELRAESIQQSNNIKNLRLQIIIKNNNKGNISSPHRRRSPNSITKGNKGIKFILRYLKKK